MFVITMGDMVGLFVLAVIVVIGLLAGTTYLALSAYYKVCDWLKSWRKK